MRSQSLEGRFARHDLPHDYPVRVYVRLVRVVCLRLHHFGRHPMERTGHTGHLSRVPSVTADGSKLLFSSGQTEISDLTLDEVSWTSDCLYEQ